MSGVVPISLLRTECQLEEGTREKTAMAQDQRALSSHLQVSHAVALKSHGQVSHAVGYTLPSGESGAETESLPYPSSTQPGTVSLLETPNYTVTVCCWCLSIMAITFQRCSGVRRGASSTRLILVSPVKTSHGEIYT